MSLTTPIHPKCGKSYPGGDGAGHCAVCCETFIGLGAFDKHFSRNEDGSYFHRTPLEVDLWWKDTRGYWHHGQRLTEEQRKELWPSDDPTG